MQETTAQHNMMLLAGKRDRQDPLPGVPQTAGFSPMPGIRIGEATRPGPIADPIFVRAARFGGPKPGYAFQTGSEGVGYYKNKGPSVSLFQALWPLQGAPPIALELDTLLHGAPLPPQPDDQPITRQPGSPPTRRGHVARRGPADCRARPLPDALPNVDTSATTQPPPSHMPVQPQLLQQFAYREASLHKKLGLWAFDTVNANAWHPASQYICGTGADFIAVQEVKIRTSP